MITRRNAGEKREVIQHPPELLHPLHPTHPLKLQIPKIAVYMSRCRLCNLELGPLRLTRNKLVYACDNLNNMCFEVGVFGMHVDCALRELPSKKHPLHQHPLVLLTEYDCFAHCADCGAELRHKAKRTADLYRCLDCNVRLHRECFESQRPITSELQVVAFAGTGRATMEIFHWDCGFTPLREITTIEEEDIKCGVCRSPVNGPAYGCEENKFFLHQHCAKLPEYFLHPMHEFALHFKLNPKKDEFVCNLCHLTHEGDDFRYFYESKDKIFKMHPFCAALKASWHHPHHEHPFVLIKQGHLLNSTSCPACGTKICSSFDNPTSYYFCLTCNISFHERCFDSPKDKHLDKHPHPLTLHFDPVPLNYEEKDYYCDSCEEKRDVHTYSYVCQECESEDFNYICHIYCDLFNKPKVCIISCTLFKI
ncbi:hypothetical protein Ancab_040642 [Ancistrocladus abbreviatus]